MEPSLRQHQNRDSLSLYRGCGKEGHSRSHLQCTTSRFISPGNPGNHATYSWAPSTGTFVYIYTDIENSPNEWRANFVLAPYTWVNFTFYKTNLICKWLEMETHPGSIDAVIAWGANSVLEMYYPAVGVRQPPSWGLNQRPAKLKAWAATSWPRSQSFRTSRGDNSHHLRTSPEGAGNTHSSVGYTSAPTLKAKRAMNVRTGYVQKSTLSI